MRISEIAVSRSIKIQVGPYEPMEHFVSVKAEIKDESELEEAYDKLTRWADEKIGFQRRILNDIKYKQSK